MYKGTTLMIKGTGFDVCFFFHFFVQLYFIYEFLFLKLFKTSKLRIKDIGNNKPNSYFQDRIKHPSGQNMPLFLFLTAFRMFKQLVFLSKKNLSASIFFPFIILVVRYKVYIQEGIQLEVFDWFVTSPGPLGKKRNIQKFFSSFRVFSFVLLKVAYHVVYRFFWPVFCQSCQGF